MGISNDYVCAVHSELRQFAVHDPGVRVELGTFGVWDGAIFQPVGNIFEDIQLEVPLEQSSSSPLLHSTFQTKSTESFEFSVNAQIQWPPGSGLSILSVKPGLAVRFRNANEFFASFGGATMVAIDNLASVMNELHRRAHLHETDPLYWDHGKYRVVTRVTRARRVDIALSRSESAGITLEAEVAAGTPDWGSAGLKTSWARESGSVVKWKPTAVDNDNHFTPLFGLCHVFREPLRSGWQVTGGPGQ